MIENEEKLAKLKEFERIEELKNLACAAEVMFHEIEEKVNKDKH
jgi:hypothetical protein